MSKSSSYCSPLPNDGPVWSRHLELAEAWTMGPCQPASQPQGVSWKTSQHPTPSHALPILHKRSETAPTLQTLNARSHTAFSFPYESLRKPLCHHLFWRGGTNCDQWSSLHLLESWTHDSSWGGGRLTTTKCLNMFVHEKEMKAADLVASHSTAAKIDHVLAGPLLAICILYYHISLEVI